MSTLKVDSLTTTDGSFNVDVVDIGTETFELVWTGSSLLPITIPGCPSSGDCLYMVQGTGSYNSYAITQFVGRSNGVETGTVNSYLQGAKLSGTSVVGQTSYTTTATAIWRIF